jgi:hypothetical protein
MIVLVFQVQVEEVAEVDIVDHKPEEQGRRDTMEEMDIWEVISRGAEVVVLVLGVLRQAAYREMVE